MQHRHNEEFPWHLCVYDAHCHPTDTISTMKDIPRMKTKALTIMATRRQDQSLVAKFADEISPLYAHEPDRFLIPAFGWHPWFSHQVFDDSKVNVSVESAFDQHYKRVIVPSPENDDFIKSLPKPRSLSSLIDETRQYLYHFPSALIGEVGLDRAFRIPDTDLLQPSYELDPALTSGSREGHRLSKYRVDMEHQRRMLKAQLSLAGEMQRAVSVHGVAAHGLVFETLAQTWAGYEKAPLSKRKKKCLESTEMTGREEGAPKPYPPRICLHSYSGTVDTLRQYLHPSTPSSIFFSFSRLVNFSSPSQKGIDAIKAVPPDRILAESDLHAAGPKMDELMEDIIKTICNIKGWSLEHGVAQLASNWRHFIFGEA